MMIYDYSSLLKAVREAKTNKVIAENERTTSKKNMLAKMENELKSSGLLDDWYDLKRTCRELGIRIMPYGGWDEAKQGVLMEEWEDFCTTKEFDNIEDALTFYMAIFVDYGFKYWVKMWQQIYVNGEMIFEEWVEPKGYVVNLMRERIDKEMKEDLRKFAIENEQLHKSNKLMDGFIKAMGKQFQEMFKDYCEREEEKNE